MKIVQHDDKHQSIREILDLGDISESEQRLLEKVLDWMDSDKVALFSRYNCATLCNEAKYEYDDGEPTIVFE